jgi:diadenosine tetraphosphate (Ap4A) HIT family hydrolase
MTYDKNNIFSRIIKGEIPADKIFENDVCIAFHDISPVAPVHVLVVPKADFISFNDFAENAKPEFVAKFFKSVREVANKLGLAENGYRVLFNHGRDASQTVFHFHVHILGGGSLHKM